MAGLVGRDRGDIEGTGERAGQVTKHGLKKGWEGKEERPGAGADRLGETEGSEA